MNIFLRYKNLSAEKRIIVTTIISLSVSSALALGKLVIGLFTDYTLCFVAVYSFAFAVCKLECVIGIKSKKQNFKRRNIAIFLLLLISSVIYAGFNCRVLFIEREIKEYSLGYAVLVAFISFFEFGLALAGLFQSKNKRYFYRNIKIINFGIALTAILTTQITLLDFTATNSEDINAFSSIAVGGFIALCSVYILIAPAVCVYGRERNAFLLKNPDSCGIVRGELIKIVLCKSTVYGSYVYRAKMNGKVADGYIERAPSLWKRMHVIFKVICCILSEILVFVWLFGRLVFFFRSINTPKRLEIIMKTNGFEKLDIE